MLGKYIELIAGHKFHKLLFLFVFRGMVIANYAKCDIQSSDRVYIFGS